MTLSKVIKYALALCLIGVIGFGAYTAIYHLQANQIKSSYDNRLSNYYESKGIAKRYMAVFAIYDNTTYKEARTSLAKYLGPSLEQTLFGQEDFGSGPMTPITYTVTGIAGEFSSTDNYTFKVEAEYTAGGSKTTKTVLITLENKFITEVRGI